MSGGRVVIVCGGSPGLAAALAVAIAANGAQVTVYENGKHLAEYPAPALLPHVPVPTLKQLAKESRWPGSVKQLRRGMRAREKQTRKMLPKGRK